MNIPRTVQVAVQQRADTLPPDAQQLLKLAAVIGRRFDFALLQRVTGDDEGTLLQLIKALLAVQLAVEGSTETFAFRHALTREALYADLLARERKALHGRIALALEEIGHSRGYEARDVIVADLSYHYYAAEQWRKALEYAQQGAERAVQLHAPRPAMEHLSRAIEATRRLSMSVPPALHRVRGQMYDLLGEFEQARDEYEAALGCAELAGDPRACWKALLGLGLLWASRDSALMGDYLRRALELARSIGDPLLLGPSLNRVGNWYLRGEQPREALRYHHEALALFQIAGDQRGLAATHDLLGLTYIISGDIPTGMTHYTQTIALFRTLGDFQGLSASLAIVSMRGASYPWSTTVWPPSDGAACVRDGEEALQIARRIDWHAGEAGALVYLASVMVRAAIMPARWSEQSWPSRSLVRSSTVSGLLERTSLLAQLRLTCWRLRARVSTWKRRLCWHASSDRSLCKTSLDCSSRPVLHSGTSRAQRQCCRRPSSLRCQWRHKGNGRAGAHGRSWRLPAMISAWRCRSSIG